MINRVENKLKENWMRLKRAIKKFSKNTNKIKLLYLMLIIALEMSNSIFPTNGSSTKHKLKEKTNEVEKAIEKVK
ncbi:hypothetical protein BpHYR1_009921 [Brachionus plicatilis]|uniref:Uncharacterized protein n=1 Tax=Brachionus plicatilis TaxID=10195 RepID=A0A3M7QP44_BRAPC|nr:hypothetical protein BpHYR1_009921 [Brachionus plicatilis]